MKRILVVLAMGVFAGSVGCDSAAAPEAQNPTEVQELAVAEPAAVNVAPVQKMMEKRIVEMGEHVFSMNCSKCHAFEGNAAPDLVGAGARLDEATFKDVVTNGRNDKMPAHPMLTDVQKTALWAFVSTATNDSGAIAKDREGEGCACGGACGGAGMAGHGHGAGAAAAADAAPEAKGCGGSCGQGAAKAPGEGCGGSCGQGAAKAPGEGCGGSCGQGAGHAPGQE